MSDIEPKGPMLLNASILESIQLSPTSRPKGLESRALGAYRKLYCSITDSRALYMYTPVLGPRTDRTIPSLGKLT